MITIKTCTNEELVESLENYCFAYANKPTKCNAAAIDKIKAEILKRLEAK